MRAPLVTTEKSFSPIGPVAEKLTLLKVAGGIDSMHALEKASALLQVIVGSIEDAAIGAQSQQQSKQR